MRYSFRIHPSASGERLEKLIEARLKPGADTELIDARIWELFGETWAIMFTDLSGFSRRVKEFGIIHFLQTIYESHRLLVPCIDACNGILLKAEGDSLMVLFKSPDRALESAIAMQRTLHVHNQGRSPEDQVLLCIGLGYGSLLKIGDEDVFGVEVNTASKLGEDMARAWEILMTEGFRAALSEPAELEALPEAPAGTSRAWRLRYAREDSASGTDPRPSP